MPDGPLNCTNQLSLAALEMASVARWCAPNANTDDGCAFAGRAVSASSAGRARQIRFGAREDRRVKSDVSKVVDRHAAEKTPLFRATQPYRAPSIPNIMGSVILWIAGANLAAQPTIRLPRIRDLYMSDSMHTVGKLLRKLRYNARAVLRHNRNTVGLI